jgi:hypothetical protein
MTGIAPIVVALLAMLFSAVSAITLITSVKHFDPPEASSAGHDETRVAV